MSNRTRIKTQIPLLTFVNSVKILQCPTEQGLRLARSHVFLKLHQILQCPIEQGLRHYHNGSKTYSKKILQCPIEQGLRHVFARTTIFPKLKILQCPIEQGLRQVIDTLDRFSFFDITMSNRTRIKTPLTEWMLHRLLLSKQRSINVYSRSRENSQSSDLQENTKYRCSRCLLFSQHREHLYSHTTPVTH